MRQHEIVSCITDLMSTYKWAELVRVCNSVKFETGQNLPPLLK